MQDGTVRTGKLCVDWDAHGNVRINRQDTVGSIELSISEWNWLIKALELCGWPVAPPVKADQQTQ